MITPRYAIYLECDKQTFTYYFAEKRLSIIDKVLDANLL